MSAPRRPASKRADLRRALREAPKPQRERPPRDAMVFFYALIFLVLTAIAGFVGGAVVIARAPAIGAVLLVFGVAAVGALWLLRQRKASGYWLTVGVLGLAGAGAMAALAATGSGVAAVFLCPPLVIAIILLRPEVRAAILTR